MFLKSLKLNRKSIIGTSVYYNALIILMILLLKVVKISIPWILIYLFHKLDKNYILALLWSFILFKKGPKGEDYYGLITINALSVNRLAHGEVQQNLDSDTWAILRHSS